MLVQMIRLCVGVDLMATHVYLHNPLVSRLDM